VLVKKALMKQEVVARAIELDFSWADNHGDERVVFLSAETDGAGARLRVRLEGVDLEMAEKGPNGSYLVEEIQLLLIIGRDGGFEEKTYRLHPYETLYERPED
jgi:hypothetical protein